MLQTISTIVLIVLVIAVLTCELVFYIFDEYIAINTKSEEIREYKIIKLYKSRIKWFRGATTRFYIKRLRLYYATFEDVESKKTIILRWCYGDYIGKRCLIKVRENKYCRKRFELVRLDIGGVLFSLLCIFLYIIAFYSILFAK